MKKNLITTAILFALPTFVFADETTKNELQPINVYSAYATPVSQNQTASSVTVLTEKEFAERNATYVSDVLKTVPGVAMGNQWWARCSNKPIPTWCEFKTYSGNY